MKALAVEPIITKYQVSSSVSFSLTSFLGLRLTRHRRWTVTSLKWSEAATTTYEYHCSHSPIWSDTVLCRRDWTTPTHCCTIHLQPTSTVYRLSRTHWPE